ncbi:MAG TPA: tetratricopeptide repeat protein, partial [Smithellaceae bacterium]|nr:tetratricopeptide repeat protein [Smithellaceae bacterium]
EHNRLDVISMATLTAHLVDLLNARALKQHAHPDDYLAAARLLLKKAPIASVKKILELLGEDACAGMSFASKKKLANLCKRAGRLDEAVRLWRQIIERNPRDFYAVSELAKHLEHRARDYARAMALIETALAGGNLFSEEEKDSLGRRLKRLTARIQS